MLNDVKTWTSRNKRYGEPGNIFTAFGANFQLLEVTSKRLDTVADNWRLEGCKSRADFIELWKEINGPNAFIGDWLVWVHIFKRVEA